MVYGTTTEAEKPEPQKVDEPSSKDHTNILLTFANDIVKILGSIPNLKDTIFKEHLKIDSIDRENITFTVPRYKRDLGIYATNKYLQEHSKIVKIIDFCQEGKEYYPPSYFNIQIKRDRTETLLMEGYMLIIYKKVPIIVSFIFDSCSPNAKFIFNKINRKIVSKLINNIEQFMTFNNFYKNEKLKLVDGIYFDFLEYPKLQWDDIIISNNLKEEILLNLVFPINNKELCKKFGLAWRRGLLLGGETGTGKTKLAKILCNLFNDCTIIWVSAESIRESSHVKTLFQAARELSPTLIVMEDLDFFGADREISRNPILGELLNQLDGNAPNEGIFVLASSNRPNLLDKALAHRPARFDIKLEFKLPNTEERIRMLKLFSVNKKLSNDVNFGEIANITSNFTGAQIQELLVYATLSCLHKNKDTITQEHLKNATKRVRENYNIDSMMVR